MSQTDVCLQQIVFTIKLLYILYTQPYSWDVGPAHIISINTEFYFFVWDGLHLIVSVAWGGLEASEPASPASQAPLDHHHVPSPHVLHNSGWWQL